MHGSYGNFLPEILGRVLKVVLSIGFIYPVMKGTAHKYSKALLLMQNQFYIK